MLRKLIFGIIFSDFLESYFMILLENLYMGFLYDK